MIESPTSPTRPQTNPSVQYLAVPIKTAPPRNPPQMVIKMSRRNANLTISAPRAYQATSKPGRGIRRSLSIPSSNTTNSATAFRGPTTPPRRCPSPDTHTTYTIFRLPGCKCEMMRVTNRSRGRPLHKPRGRLLHSAWSGRPRSSENFSTTSTLTRRTSSRCDIPWSGTDSPRPRSSPSYSHCRIPIGDRRAARRCPAGSTR